MTTNGCGVCFWDDEYVLDLEWWSSHYLVKVLKMIELYILKGKDIVC